MGALCSTATSKVVALNAIEPVKAVTADPVAVEISSVVTSTETKEPKETEATVTTNATKEPKETDTTNAVTTV